MKRRAFVLGTMAFVATPALAFENDVLKQVNKLRRRRGRKKLRWSETLAQAARNHAADMQNNAFFDHTGSNGSSVGSRARQVGYGWCTVAENIAQGQQSLSAVIEDWNDSRGHRRNMLDRDVTEIGLARSQVGNYWVMVLAKPGC